MFTAFISILLALGINYAKTRELFLQELRSTVMSMAATTASFIDGDVLKTIKTRQDETTPAYEKIKAQLFKVRVANRRKDIYVKFIYTISPSPTDPNTIVFGVDAAKSVQNISHVGDVYPEAALYDIVKNIHHQYAPRKFIHDQWGTWMTGFAPIKDSQGQYVATLAVDIAATDISQLLSRIVNFEFIAMIAVLVLAAGAAFILARVFSRSLNKIALGVQEIGRGNLKYRVELKTKDEFNDLAIAINHMAKGLEERERIKLGFSRYVSHQVLQKILESETSAKLEGERKKVTILFSDIRQFNQLIEKYTPEEIVSFLNEYFNKMMDVIFKNNGTLDKFISDGIMVEFGAPLDDPIQEKNAVVCALEMQEELKKLCDKWEKEGKTRIDMGIGIHTGLAVVGNVGSDKRLEYTAIGDTVNVASRLEHATKSFKMPILISETTYEPIKDQFKAENLGPIELPGRREKIIVYAISASLSEKKGPS
jgi:adenylate cyclase